MKIERMKEWIRMIYFNNVSKYFKNVLAVNQASFDIKEGECTALVGVNGAGKSTIIDMLIGNLHADKGNITSDFNLKQQTGILYQRTEFPDLIRVRELFELYTQLYTNHLNMKEFKELTRFDDEQLNQFATHLSGGQQRILDFALTVMGKPRFIILDEPTSAMDATMRKYFWKVIEAYKKEGKTIFYTTHYLEEVEKMADRVIVLSKGSIVNDNIPSIIRQQVRKSTIHVPIKYQHLLVKEIQSEFQIKQQEILIISEEVEDVLMQLIKLNINLNEIEITKASLADYIFEEENLS
ncbi:ABC transporter ATP-binding protein [Staphylococcus piscifermentans]|nr:ABC transporter ATP-binding protein [Staphylococcus piscifermentans]